LTTLDLGYNGLYSRNETVNSFVEGLNPGWSAIQTVAPINATAALQENGSLKVSWTPIAYQGGTGRYFIKYRAEDEGGFTTITVEGKGSSEGMIPNLVPGKKYLIYVQTQTDSHLPFNPGAVTSELSEVLPYGNTPPIRVDRASGFISACTKQWVAMTGARMTAAGNNPVNFSAPGTEFLWEGIRIERIGEIWSVTGIDLSTNNLNGTLPDLFAAFPNLTSLNLSGNCLAGAVPASLSSLQNLQSIEPK
jgi:hypothetical protein